VLSGGEKSRLILAKLLINPPNCLLLDEPTTHLDVDAVEALVRALQSYEGTIVFISHDIYFVRSVANTVFEVKAGRVRKFPGSFDYYLEKKDSFGDDTAVSRHKPVNPEKRRREEEKLKTKDAEKKNRDEEKKRKAHNAGIRDKIGACEKKIEVLELESYAKARSLSNPKFYHDEEKAKEYGRRLKEIEKETQELKDLIVKLESQMLI
jgi:ATP-binding cassette subfamily F protein 3